MTLSTVIFDMRISSLNGLKMKSIRYATYLAIALHFIRLSIRRMSTLIIRIPRNAQGKPDKERLYTLYSTKVIMFYKLCVCPHLLFALECYTIESNEAETLLEYLEGRYKDFKETICMFNATADIQYMLKECLDPTFRKTILESSPIIGEDLKPRAIIEDLTRFCKENFHYEPSFDNFVCKIK